MRTLLLIVLLLPQLAMARVFMCVDPATGDTSFSDTGCSASASQEEVRVQDTNVDSGRATAGVASRKSWVSERDTRKTGLDYSAERRSLTGSGSAAAKVIEPGDES